MKTAMQRSAQSFILFIFLLDYFPVRIVNVDRSQVISIGYCDSSQTI